MSQKNKCDDDDIKTTVDRVHDSIVELSRILQTPDKPEDIQLQKNFDEDTVVPKMHAGDLSIPVAPPSVVVSADNSQVIINPYQPSVVTSLASVDGRSVEPMVGLICFVSILKFFFLVKKSNININKSYCNFYNYILSDFYKRFVKIISVPICATSIVTAASPMTL